MTEVVLVVVSVGVLLVLLRPGGDEEGLAKHAESGRDPLGPDEDSGNPMSRERELAEMMKRTAHKRPPISGGEKAKLPFDDGDSDMIP